MPGRSVSAWWGIGVSVCRSVALFLLLALCSRPALAACTGSAVGDWYNSCWAYRQAITIDQTKVPNTDQIDFPVLISTTQATLKFTGSGGHVGLSTGTDILFTASDGLTKYNHDIETYTATTGKLVAWVRVSTLSHTTDTTLYMYYGNADAPNQQNSTGTWDANFAAVYHLVENPVVSAPQMTDSTANGLHASSSGTWTSAGQAAGKVGGSLNFNGTDNGISINALAATSLDINSNPVYLQAG